MIPITARLARSKTVSLRPNEIPKRRQRSRAASLPPPMSLSPPPPPPPNRDTVRQLHALSEFLATELGYLLDLRILVSVCLFSSFAIP